MILTLFILMLVKYSVSTEDFKTKNDIKYNEPDEHSLVIDNNIFPYVVAILKKSTFLSAGALIDENWVLTAADALFMVRESTRVLRVRLGSINYKKGGLLLPIKYFDIHPYFDDNSPNYDVALVKLAHSIRFTPNLKSIRLQSVLKEIDSTHFIVTSWLFPNENSDESQQVKSIETIKRQRLLTVSHLNPSDVGECFEELTSAGINNTASIMCLDTAAVRDPCMRDIGAPVVLNDILWGIVSSWKPSNCQNELAGPTLVNIVSAPKIRDWIHSRLRGYTWKPH